MVTKKSGPKSRKPASRKPIKKQSSDKTSTLAAKVLKGQKPTPKQAKSLAGSVLSQDETKGKRSKRSK